MDSNEAQTKSTSKVDENITLNTKCQPNDELNNKNLCHYDNDDIYHPHHHNHHHHHHHQHKNAPSSELCEQALNLVFKNVSYEINTNRSRSLATRIFCSTCDDDSGERVKPPRKILDDVSGYIEPGQLLAVLGPSGSGKTTLLNILSGRLKPDTGCITVNEQTLNKRIRRKICYVLQHDIFFPDLTLKQTLIYTALLRLPDSMSYAEKLNKVDQIIDLLDLKLCKNTIIGDIMKRGLSGGEKKRVNIACELLTNPSIMLVDEPTSGLDSSTALNIIKTLKNYAVREKKALIITIHQPSSQIFHQFDKLLLLSAGRTAYFGDIDNVVNFMDELGYTVDAHYNPADFLLDKIRSSAEAVTKMMNAAKKLPKTPQPSSPQSTTTAFHVNMDEMDLDMGKKQTTELITDKANQSSYLDEDEEPTENRALWYDQKQQRNFHHHHHNQHNHHHSNNHNNHHQHHHHHHNHHHHRRHEDESYANADAKGVEVRVIMDASSKKTSKIFNKVINDDDSGRSSYAETDRSSTMTFSSSSSTSSTDDIYATTTKTCSGGETNLDDRWPTSFWTQFKVLTRRNFFEARGRLLSKLNWIQTIGLAIITGLMWFQTPRTEHSLNDIRGWMFFATSYWLLFAWFGALISIPTEVEVVNRERLSGAYRLSSYYLAKAAGELPLTITPPTVFFLISYPMLGYSNITAFLLQWFFLVFNSVAAQSIGFFIGMSSKSVETSVMFSALYSTSTNLFAGFFSTSIPSWLSWAKYFSIVYYAFNTMQLIEFQYGPPITCSPENSRIEYCINEAKALRNGSTIPFDQLVKSMDDGGGDNWQPPSIWLNAFALLLFLLIFRLLGYLVLRFVRKPK